MVLISYDIIDCHAHITASGKWFNTPFEASYEILKKNMDLIGIQKTILIPFTSISREDLFFCLEIAKKEPDKFAVAPQIELQDIDLLEGYEKYIVGLKVHPRFNNSKPDSPAIYQLLDHASDIEKPVIFCTYLHSTSVPLRYLEPFVYDELAKKYPDVVFVLAHSCWPRLLDA
ncbi:amidohydrolase family protein, partial [Methanocalculus sp.]|uniref:amidohydrolase family protein n=1 Tax=Methanocalculus sp. TaxID=2004547 RepID=UPI0026062FD7